MDTQLNAEQRQQAKTLLLQGANTIGIEINEQQQQHLLNYLQQLLKWNKAYNLTAIKDYQQMIRLHLLDSLAIVPHIQQLNSTHNPRLLDVGTGAGLPGVIFAIMLPHWHISLLDSNGKKMRFLFHIKTSLQLPLTLVNERVESYHTQPFDFISSRAFAALDKMVANCSHLLLPQGYFIAMKGQYPQTELDTATTKEKRLKLIQSKKINVPNESAERHFLALQLSP